MARLIPLSNGGEAIVDDSMYDLLNRWRWVRGNKGDARRNTRAHGTIRMHQMVLPGAALIDHINGNKLDNRRENLRAASRSLNGVNRHKLDSRNTTGARNVYYDSRARKKKWFAKVCRNRRGIFLGYFLTKNEAIAVAEGYRQNEVLI